MADQTWRVYRDRNRHSDIFNQMLAAPTLTPFVVENAGNTCYLDSLLMALFFSPSNPSNEYLLSNNTDNPQATYLQELIRTYFVDRVRNSRSVTRECISMILQQCVYMGWLKGNPSEIHRQQDSSELYIFLMDKLMGQQIQIQRESIHSALKSDTDQGRIETIPYIPLSLPTDLSCREISVKKMLENWMYDNTKTANRELFTAVGRTTRPVAILDINHIMNQPTIMALGINRFQNGVEGVEGVEGSVAVATRNPIDVIIQKRIFPFHHKEGVTNKPEWEFHAAVCHRGQNISNGHYYCVLVHRDEYYMFDDMVEPCIRKIQMQDRSVTDQIKKECVFLLYKLAV